jgi:hypothetical protein
VASVSAAPAAVAVAVEDGAAADAGGAAGAVMLVIAPG